MPEDIFSLFPNWDDPSYRRYWLKHNLNSDLWQDYSGADLRRALASEGRYVSENMFYDVRAYMLSNDERVANFNALRDDETIPLNMHEYEPYWSMTSDYMYIVQMLYENEEGDIEIFTRAMGSNEQLTKDQVNELAGYYFGVKGRSDPIPFDSIYISNAYRR